MVVNNLIEKEEKPEVTINSKNYVKEGKSVGTNIPAIEHFFDDKIRRHQVLDDGKHGDDLKEPDHYYVPKVRSDHYEANTGEADHYKATLERTDKIDESTEVSEDNKKEALVIASHHEKEKQLTLLHMKEKKSEKLMLTLTQQDWTKTLKFLIKMTVKDKKKFNS